MVPSVFFLPSTTNPYTLSLSKRRPGSTGFPFHLFVLFPDTKRIKVSPFYSSNVTPLYSLCQGPLVDCSLYKMNNPTNELSVKISEVLTLIDVNYTVDVTSLFETYDFT